MSGTEGLLAASFGAQAIGTKGQAYASAKAYQIQGEYQKSVSKLNMRIAAFQAEDAIRRGEESVDLFEQQVSQVIGSQRAGFAAQGIEVDEGTAFRVQQDTKRIAKQEVLKLRANAFRESFGYKMQAVRENATGQFSSIAANLSSTNTLLTGGVSSLSSVMKGVYQGGFLGAKSSNARQ